MHSQDMQIMMETHNCGLAHAMQLLCQSSYVFALYCFGCSNGFLAHLRNCVEGADDLVCNGHCVHTCAWADVMHLERSFQAFLKLLLS